MKLIAIVLDKSASMELCRDATISGFNEFLSEMKREVPDARLSLTLFDTTYQERHNGVAIDAVPVLDQQSYQPSGNTALYDAIGRTIRAIERLPEQPERVMVAIVTDGEENSSHEYNQKQIFDLISWHRNEGKGWDFTFIGANQDSYAAGGAMGIAAANITNYNQTPLGTQVAYAASADVAGSYLRGESKTASFTSKQRKKVESTR